MAVKQPSPPPAPRNNVDSGDILGDPVLSQTLREDPVLLFIRDHWQRILVILVIAGLGYWATTIFRQTYRDRMADAADLYGRVRKEYSEYKQISLKIIPLSADATDEQRKALEENKKSLDQERSVLKESLRALADSREPYMRIAKLYQALLARSENRLADAKQLLSGINWNTGRDDRSKERFYNELAALILARATLDDHDSAVQGKALLKTLASDGNFVYVSAGLALAQLASSKEEANETALLLESMVARAPKQNEIVRSELDRLKNMSASNTQPTENGSAH